MSDVRSGATSVGVTVTDSINAFPDSAGEITYLLSVKPSVIQLR